ncbi:hypothetical protein DACRYDRAFT_110518 [Dacryopinax primogenitus]|uniref:Uncharacterized protein n=1 Tax=Dacryopinax primogenitus (strain DJM 731) TaxID=1858805 RepID=M5FS44_DACPD|nr:uncharacterized protein DACRYDRAFT_110518 [Dacryopinax primogenitus]EJT98608.1 hypothetical protein DACRYDRAFT_110518 [Dacryopinax primogenitus]
MAPSSTWAASGKKPSSTKAKPKASLNKKPAAADMKKSLRAWKASGKKTWSKELTPEPEPVANHPASNAKAASTQVTPSKKTSAPPSKTSTPKLRVSSTRLSTQIEKELELHEEPEEKQEPETATEERVIEEGGEANDESPEESHVKETTVEPMEGEEEGEQPRKGLSEILAMVQPFGGDLNAWRANGGMSKFWIELVKFILRHNRKKYWQALPSTAVLFMGPTFEMQWHMRMAHGNQLMWVEGDRKAVVGRDNKPPFDSGALRHQTELEAILASNKEPDENLKAVIEAEEKAWNALSTTEQVQHLLAVQTYCQASFKGSPLLPVSKVVTPIPSPKKATPVCSPSQSRVSISAAASLPPLPLKSLSMVKSTPAPDDSKKASKVPKKKLSAALLALAAEAEVDLLPMPNGVLQSHMLEALKGMTKATMMAAKFDADKETAGKG